MEETRGIKQEHYEDNIKEEPIFVEEKLETEDEIELENAVDLQKLPKNEEIYVWDFNIEEGSSTIQSKKRRENHQCAICRGTFLDPSSLSRHMKIHTEEETFKHQILDRYTDPHKMLEMMDEMEDEDCYCISSDNSDFDDEIELLSNSDDPGLSDEEISRPKRKRMSIPKVTENSSGTANLNDGRILMSDEEMIGKDGTIWKTKPIAKTSKTKIPIRPGPTAETRYTDDIPSCFHLFFSEEIINIIFKFTNIEISIQRAKYKRNNNRSLSDVSMAELKALLGLIIFSGAMRNNHLPIPILFSNRCGKQYLSAFCRRRFEFLISCLRFDQRSTRDPSDKFAPIRNLWDLFIANCKKYYKPGSYVAIDEQFIGFRGRCPFRMYLPSKSEKYGMKIIMMCDNNSKYMIDAVPYLGKGSIPKGKPAAEYFVEHLAQSIKKSNRNVTVDNKFTSIPLFRRLKHDYGLTALGTVNKRELPSNFVDINFQKRKANSSLFLFDPDIAAVSYIPRSNKLVCLISTLHDDDQVESSGEPLMYVDYNQTKDPINTLDQLCHKSNMIRKTKRWPMCYFYNIINIACINSYVIYCENSYRNTPNSKPLSRLDFLLKLSDDLMREWISMRMDVRGMHKQTKEIISNILNGSYQTNDLEPTTSVEDQANKRTTCKFCSYKKRRMTKVRCSKCHVHVCGEHQRKTIYCVECGANVFPNFPTF